MTTHELEITVRSPVHIGSGGPLLRNGIDFVSHGRFLYVLDIDAVFEHILPDAADAEMLDRIVRTSNLGSFLQPADFTSRPELFRYRLGGTSRLGEVRPQIKDAWGRIYLPGSTLKGSIRTALGTALAVERRMPLTISQLGPRREWAARDVEQSIFGRAPRPAQAPNYDLLRAIQVADSGPVPAENLDLQNVVVWPAGERGIPIDVEAIRPGSVFRARLKLDEYLLGPTAEHLRFGPGIETLRQWVAICQEHGVVQLRQEASFFEGRAPEIERYYGELIREAEARDANSFFAQSGWGAGWHSKTFSRVIKPNRELLEQIIQRYRLTRGYHQIGAPFPKTRHVVADRDRPLLPMGWIRVRVG